MFLILGLESFISRNIRTFFKLLLFSRSESSLLKIFHLRDRMFHFPKYKFHFRENVRNYLRVDLFYLLLFFEPREFLPERFF